MRKLKYNNQIKKDFLIEDNSFSLHKSKGNGILRRQIWQNTHGDVTRYSLAYINAYLFVGDNGRVLGYDNAHGVHHKHYFGKIEIVQFTNYEEIKRQFQHEFEVIHETFKKKK